MKNKAKVQFAKEKALVESRRMMQVSGEHMGEVEHLLFALRRAYHLSLLYGEMCSQLDEEAQLAVADGEEPRRGWARRVYVEATDTAKAHTAVEIDPMLSAGRDKYHIHPFVTEFNQWCAEHARIAKLCIDVKIDQRQLEINEDLARHFMAAIEALLDRLGVQGPARRTQLLAIAQDIRKLPA